MTNIISGFYIDDVCEDISDSELGKLVSSWGVDPNAFRSVNMKSSERASARSMKSPSSEVVAVGASSLLLLLLLLLLWRLLLLPVSARQQGSSSHMTEWWTMSERSDAKCFADP